VYTFVLIVRMGNSSDTIAVWDPGKRMLSAAEGVTTKTDGHNAIKVRVIIAVWVGHGALHEKV
jgi:hypothetical protein